MIFNSLNFILFFLCFFFLYYFSLKENTKAQNWLLLVSSYFFYGMADWQMIPLLLIATITFYVLGIVIQTSTEKKSSLLTTLGVVLGVGLLLYFKYLNFFIGSFAKHFDSIGLQVNWGTFNIILPLGISFFTFRLISYVIEIHRGKIEATKDFVAFATYVAFFPTIMSGPIDRPNSFIPQLVRKRHFNYDLAVNGCRQILWGVFQKIVIADNLAEIVNLAWLNIPSQSGSTLLIVAILYSFQIYTDFSGYSHIAIGIGKIMGFQITRNFNYPYFSRNMAEFWRNWHISLTSWLTDYIFMPLNIKFRNFGNLGLMLAISINMLVVGLWHGANWTFILFGLIHGLLYIPLILSGAIFRKKKLKTNKYGLPSFNDSLRIVRTFLLLTLTLIIFRAESVNQSVVYISKILSFSVFEKPNFSSGGLTLQTIYFILIFILIEWFSKEREFPFIHIRINKLLQFLLYYSIIFAIMYFGNFGANQFIYFKF